MTRYVAFLRAINVAGHATVKMSALRDAFAAAGFRNVSTYIQSGNILFESGARDRGALLRRIAAALRPLIDEKPDIILRTVEELEELVDREPFEHVDRETAGGLYVVFLAGRPRTGSVLPAVSRKEGLELIAVTEGEVLVVSRRKPNGSFGFPNAFVEKELGVVATSRNWSTVTTIVALARRAADA